MAKQINNFSEISADYDAMFCDLWGCLHNGKKSFKPALAMLKKFKRNGGIVILITNAPRPEFSVKSQIEQMGITTDCYDEIVTSGDAAQESLFSGDFGTNIFHIGPHRDLSFFQLQPSQNNYSSSINLVNFEDAESIVCTGLFNEMKESPADYQELLSKSKIRDLKLLCVNPDLSVDFGDKRLWCAGSIAKAYTDSGGKSVYFGKPHKPIYEIAFKKLKALNQQIEKDRIICIGDGISTDILGGNTNGMDTLFVCSGLARFELKIFNDSSPIDSKTLNHYFKLHRITPTSTIGHLR